VSLILYMDHHVHAGITAGLRRRGVDVLTAAQDGASDWDDEPLLERAGELGRVLFTQDDDLLAITHAWLKGGRDFSGLVYGHQLALTVGQAVRDLELMARVLNPEEMRNRIEFLPFGR